jgi:hypothetical protein
MAKELFRRSEQDAVTQKLDCTVRFYGRRGVCISCQHRFTVRILVLRSSAVACKETSGSRVGSVDQDCNKSVHVRQDLLACEKQIL